VQPLADWALPQTLRAHRETLIRLGDVYKQLNASFGLFSMYTLKASTTALASGSATDDSKYTAIEDSIATLTSQRNTLASQIKAGLSAAAFDGQALNEQQAKSWIDQAQSLIDQAASLAAP
jgi:predicted transcriptional regulator